MAARKKKEATGLQADLIQSATGKGKEPSWDILVPPGKTELARALSFYNTKSYKPEDHKKWALVWLAQHHPDLVAAAEEAPAYRFHTIGALMRMQARGMIWDDRVKGHVDVFLRGIKSIKKDVPEDDEVEVKKVKKPKVNAISQSFDDALDDAINDPKAVVSFEIDPSHDTSEVIARCEDALDHFTVEGVKQYPAHMKKWFKAVIEKLAGIKKIVKVRKPRKVRVKKINPLKMTAKVKYQKECKELKIVSRSPVDIIGKNKVYLYDTKYKRLSKIVCADASGFIMKGTTIMNIDTEKSNVTFLRKPQDHMKAGMGIRELDRVFSTSKSKRSPEAKGRLAETTLIMNVS